MHMQEWDARMRAEQIALDIARSVARNDHRQDQQPSSSQYTHGDSLDRE